MSAMVWKFTSILLFVQQLVQEMLICVLDGFIGLQYCSHIISLKIALRSVSLKEALHTHTYVQHVSNCITPEHDGVNMRRLIELHILIWRYRDHSGYGFSQWETMSCLFGWAHTQNDPWDNSPPLFFYRYNQSQSLSMNKCPIHTLPDGHISTLWRIGFL